MVCSLQKTRFKSTFLLGLVVVASVLIPFLFWHGAWFGRVLEKEELGRYLESQEKPRHIQHGLAQIVELIEQSDPDVRQWYPKVAQLADHPLAEIRITAAWVMGQENQSEEFHRALLHMLTDPEPLVRRNAALALIRFGDSSGRRELWAMLQTHAVRAPGRGTVSLLLEEGERVERGTRLARLIVKGEEKHDVLAPLPGAVKTRWVQDGSPVKEGDELVVLSPNSMHVWESLRALYLIGTLEDLKVVEALSSDHHFGEQIRTQARLTGQAIRQRAGPSTTDH